MSTNKIKDKDIIHFSSLDDELFSNLKKIVNDYGEQRNNTLAGNIREEFDLSKHIPLFEPFLLNQINNSKLLMSYLHEYNVLYKNASFMQNTFWVNFQKKHEFNPVHVHTGLYSFIVFIQIPFINEIEKKQSPGVNSNSNNSGMLQFLYPCLNRIETINIHADKRWEGKCLIFPAYLNHCVYPFYSSDKHRITLSGNVVFRN